MPWSDYAHVLAQIARADRIRIKEYTVQGITDILSGFDITECHHAVLTLCSEQMSFARCTPEQDQDLDLWAQDLDRVHRKECIEELQALIELYRTCKINKVEIKKDGKISRGLDRILAQAPIDVRDRAIKALDRIDPGITNRKYRV